MIYDTILYHHVYQGTPGTPQNEDRTETDPTRTDAKTQTNSIYLAQVPQNSRFWSFQQQKARREQFWFPQRRYSQLHVGDQPFRKTLIWKFFSSTEQEKQRIAPKALFRGCGRNSRSSPSIQNVLVRSYTTTPKSKELLEKLAFGAVDGIPKATNEYKTCLSDPTTAPRSKELLQKLVFGAVDGIPQAANEYKAWLSDRIPQPRKANKCCKSSFSELWTEFHKQPMTDPATVPKSEQLLQKFVFGAVDGIPQAHWQIRPQPRKAKNCSKSYSSGLWTEFHKQPMTDPATAPKTSFWSNSLLFRSCGRICHWLLVEFRPYPRKRAFAAIVYFSGLWQDLSLLLVEFRPQPRKRAFGAIVSFSGLCQDLSLAPCGILPTAPKTSFWSNCVLFGAVVGSVIGCLWNSVHSPENELLEQLCAFRGCGGICHWLLVEFRPQPQERAHGAIVCSSLAACGIPSTAPKTSFWSNCVLFGAVVGSVIGCLWKFRAQPRKRAFWSNSLLFGAVVGSVIGCLWNSVHSPENELLEQLCAFRDCGRICHWLLVEFRPQPRKRAFGAIVCFSGLW